VKKLRIAVWHNLPSGGGKRQLFTHVKGLIERGHYVESWCPDTADQKFLPLSELVKENIVPLSSSSLNHSPLKPLSGVRKLVSVLDEHCRMCADRMKPGGFDVLFANACMFLRTSAIAGYAGLPSALYLGEPYRWLYEALPELPWIGPPATAGGFRDSVRGLFNNRRILGGARLQARTELEYARSFDRILANSIYSRESILKAYNLDSSVCYLGIDTDLYKPTGEQKENFVVGLGTIYHAKGPDRAIRAVGTIPREIRPTLVWVGNGAYQSDLDDYFRLAASLGVNFLPRLHIPDSEVISLLSRACAIVFTSRLEPFGLAPLEANACGTAAVGIAEGGVKETVVNGVNGFLALEDDPQQLGALITRLCNRLFAVDMGVASREHVLHSWNLECCTDNIENALRRTISAAGTAEQPLPPCISIGSPGDLSSTDDIRYHIEETRVTVNSFHVKGWAFIENGEDTGDAEIFVLVRCGASLEAYTTVRSLRTDVTGHFNNGCNYDLSGFLLQIPVSGNAVPEFGIMIVRGGQKSVIMPVHRK